MAISSNPLSEQVIELKRLLDRTFQEQGIAIHGRRGRAVPTGTDGLFYNLSGFGQKGDKHVTGQDRYSGVIHVGLAFYVPDQRANDAEIETAETTVDLLEWTVENNLGSMLQEKDDVWLDLYTYRDSSRPTSPPALRPWRLSQMYIRIEVK